MNGVPYRFAKLKEMGSVPRRVWWLGVVGLSAILMACSSKPPGVTTPGAGSTAGSGGSGVDTDTNGVGGTSPGMGGSNVFFEDPPGDAGGVGETCRTDATCEEAECGPIANGCGDFIQCGGCAAPATCGGAGVASHCGVPGTGGVGGDGTCEPATCDLLDVACGQHGDGCGGVLSCGGCSVEGEECVQGQCQQTTGCTPFTCAAYPESGRCGPVSDGCSGILNCPFGACANGERCGAQEPGFCGVETCEPWSCEEALAGKPVGYCGFVSNGCDGALNGCATVCGSGEACGVSADGGAYLEVCGPIGSGGTCTPFDQNAACAGKCGVISNGCSGIYTCGTCAVGQTCGANQTPNVCGASACVPTTCAAQNAECGRVDDGCGGFVACAACSVPGESCAGGGVPFECGAPGCQPMDHTAACAAAGNATCGDQTDGCSGIISCGTCSNGQTCGGGGTANQCGSSCVAMTCDSIGASCGPQGDGCGNQIECGNCPSGKLCQGNPSACVPDLSCPNLCQHQATTCDPGSETRISGKVYAPNGTEALYNALVYVPNIAELANLPAITSGPSCERCEDEDLGEPLVAAITGPDGAFTLNNVPSGVDFPLVVKMGKWRRVTMIPAVADCSSNVLAADDARLPRHMGDGAVGLVQHVNIPKIAIVTGKVDAIECVMRKIGIVATEFTAPAGNGRIHLYKGYQGGSAARDAQNNLVSTDVSQLFDGAGTPANDIGNYDMGILDCEGGARNHNAHQAALHAYADAGGRVFASHYSYTYLDGNGDFEDTATWDGQYNQEGTTTTGIVDVTHPKGQAFDAWLGNANALHPTYGDGYINIIDPRGFVQAVTPGITERFVYTQGTHVVPGFSGTGTQPNGNINVADSIQQYSFNTPVGSAPEAACGRVLYSAFHVAGTNLSTDNKAFPEYCNTAPLTAQEKILEFMIFDLSACVSTSVPPSCDPQSCSDLGSNCGYVSDGCGGIQNCGTCVAPASCGGGGTANACGSTCNLTNCSDAGATCGTIGDGCGGTLNCGACTTGTVCGGGGTANVCGTPACTPRSCRAAGATCGTIGDGCGGTLNCGTCVSPQFCGGGGANTCGTTTCTPTGCGTANCGSVGDGCGNAISCGSCPSGSSCGAGGPNRCGAVCTPRTCDDAGANCGSIGDGCGGVLNCGSCSEGVICGGGSTPTPNVCGGTCTSVTCTSAQANCGKIGDGCGGILSCGTCPTGQVCGASQANHCGRGTCTPDTCGVGMCGIHGDGCSGTINCGPCNGCVPFSCASHVDCGPVADGCGGLVDCGVCVNGNTCGGGGVASRCGGGIQ